MLFQWREAFVVLLGGRKKRENRSINLIVFLCYVVLNLLSSLFNYLSKQYSAIHFDRFQYIEVVAKQSQQRKSISPQLRTCVKTDIYFLFVLLNLITNIQQSFYVMTKINDETMGHSIFLLFFPNAPNNWMQLYSYSKVFAMLSFFYILQQFKKKLLEFIDNSTHII